LNIFVVSRACITSEQEAILTKAYKQGLKSYGSNDQIKKLNALSCQTGIEVNIIKVQIFFLP
jgi:hypothetical protein